MTALESKAGPAIPATLPPSGPAGGVLTGSFPNPSGLAENSVGSPQIADGGVAQSDLSLHSVGADELKGTYERVSQGVGVAANHFGSATASCDSGDVVLGGGYAWEDPNVVPSPDFVSTDTVFSTPNVSTGGFDNPDQWIVEASPLVDNTLFAWAVCLRV